MGWPNVMLNIINDKENNEITGLHINKKKGENGTQGISRPDYNFSQLMLNISTPNQMPRTSIHGRAHGCYVRYASLVRNCALSCSARTFHSSLFAPLGCLCSWRRQRRAFVELVVLSAMAVYMCRACSWCGGSGGDASAGASSCI